MKHMHGTDDVAGLCVTGLPEPSEFSDSLMSEGEGKGVCSTKAAAIEQVPSAKPYPSRAKLSDSFNSLSCQKPVLYIG